MLYHLLQTAQEGLQYFFQAVKIRKVILKNCLKARDSSIWMTGKFSTINWKRQRRASGT
jgi:hypothetical protein